MLIQQKKVIYNTKEFLSSEKSSILLAKIQFQLAHIYINQVYHPLNNQTSAAYTYGAKPLHSLTKFSPSITKRSASITILFKKKKWIQITVGTTVKKPHVK